MVDEQTIFKESKVLELKDFGSLFFLLRDFDILPQTHGKEEGKKGELQDATLQLRQLLLGNFCNDAGGDGFLLFFLWFCILVGLELAL